MRYSLVELAPVTPGGTKREALERALAAAEEAEQLGYHRCWFAEHHHVTGYAAQDPAPLIAAAAQRTARIRLGSGAVLLNHHSPFTVAERFLMLESLAPGRIDLGLGRATATPLIDLALQRDRTSRPADDFADQVQEIIGYLHTAFDRAHPFAAIDLTPGVDGTPEVWVLGGSGSSAGLAARLGIGYTFGGHIRPELASRALRHYRDRFTGTTFGAGAPQAMLALNIVAADDETSAHRLTWPARALRAGGRDRPIPTLRQAEAELSAAAKAQPSTIAGGVIPAQISGTPATLRAQLEPVIRAAGATEVMIQDMLTDPEARTRSRQIIAETLRSIAI
ncbi:MsnO8 family LLM class oxidoreductase [Dactylosporangium matsuzakiense]|uniref:Alkane monooxygenase n=1 Tax=Dactylosporangium matsuzakiense TaxID=53360 RepID=A0A9W6KL75_9ACTN|nr:MsnO8 family LLM class oxidoreductase [Dactylosporangium matsuzakiense]GLL02180.1 alkane monooxygenase [Dactylosporangium matsuzakiense]